jgi:MFS family permease
VSRTAEESPPTATRYNSEHPHYRWVALSNTTVGVLMATINASIVIISLPAIFRGIGLEPLAPGNVSYLLWMLMGFLLVSAVLVVSLGRLGDMYGRVRVYRLGFVVFTSASVILAGCSASARSVPATSRACSRRSAAVVCSSCSSSGCRASGCRCTATRSRRHRCGRASTCCP